MSRHWKSRCTWWLVLFPLFASRADAHLVTTGLGPVYDGIGHLFLSPEDLLPVIALALFAGLRGATAGRRALFTLPAAWFCGGLAGLFCKTAPPLPIPIFSFLALGILLASDLRLPAKIVAAIAVALGLIHGWLNGASLSESGTGALAFIGIAASLFVLTALFSALVVALRPPWTRIAVRVAGSWIAAIGLLMLGWSLRGRA